VGVMNKRRVHLLYGPNVKDIVLLYGVASEVEVLEWPVAAVAAVQIEPVTGAWLAPVGNNQVVNHSVVGRLDPGLESDTALPPHGGGVCVHVKRHAELDGPCMSPLPTGTVGLTPWHIIRGWPARCSRGKPFAIPSRITWS